MDKRKLNRVFKEIKTKAKLDFAITNIDEWGDCNTCAQSIIFSEEGYGQNAKGIYTRHWLTGMNKDTKWKDTKDVYIWHDISEDQANILVKVFKENGYHIEPEVYNPMKCFKIEEV